MEHATVSDHLVLCDSQPFDLDLCMKGGNECCTDSTFDHKVDCPDIQFIADTHTGKAIEMPIYICLLTLWLIFIHSQVVLNSCLVLADLNAPLLGSDAAAPLAIANSLWDDICVLCQQPAFLFSALGYCPVQGAFGVHSYFGHQVVSNPVYNRPWIAQFALVPWGTVLCKVPLAPTPT